jgi:protein TonB
MSDSALGGARGFVGQHRTSVRVGIAAVIIAGIIAFLLEHTASQPPVHQAPVITMVVIQPPKPPPPPPPLPQPKMITPPKMTTPVLKPVIPNAPPKPAPPKAASAAPALGTSLKSNGANNAFDLGGDPGGNGLIGGGGGGGGSAEGYFQSVVSAQIRDALAANPATRNASAGLQVFLWVDPSGLVTRVALKKSSGDPAVDAAITSQVLNHMQLRQPPPAGDPMPISISLVGETPLQ